MYNVHTFFILFLVLFVIYLFNFLVGREGLSRLQGEKSVARRKNPWGIFVDCIRVDEWCAWDAGWAFALLSSFAFHPVYSIPDNSFHEI